MLHDRTFWRFMRPFLLIALVVIAATVIVAVSAPVSLSVLVTILCLVLATAIVTGIIVSRRLSRSLTQLKQKTKHIANGEYDTYSLHSGISELDEVADSLSSIAEQLAARSGVLSQQSQEYHTITANMIEGVLVVDADEKIVSINQSAARMFDVDLKATVGRTLQDTVRHAELQKLVGRALTLDVAAEGDIILAGRDERYLQVTGTAMRSNSGARLGALIVLNDVTRIRKLENLRREFVANVSHELKTPITSIKGYIETLLDSSLENPVESRRFLEIIGKQAARLQNIIEDLLRLSRIEQDAERGQIVLQPVGLRSILAAAITACDSLTSAKHISVTLSCPEDLRVRANQPLLEQAVINLIDNAVKYSEPGKRIDVAAARGESSVTIAVRDQGCGIAPEHLTRLFERFYRVDKSRSRAEGGTGLGLAISKHIVIAHNGTLSVDSKVGQGSTFTIHLPSK